MNRNVNKEENMNKKDNVIQFKTPYNANSCSRTSDLGNFPNTLTKQSFKDECDINNILKKYESTGVLPSLILENPQYGDYSDVPAYQTALDTVMKAEEQFMSLSAKLRDRFDNDPAKFLAFVDDPSNAQELYDLGLTREGAAAKATKELVDVPKDPDEAK